MINSNYNSSYNDISIVIPVINQLKSLNILLDKILNLSLKPNNIIIVNSGDENYSNQFQDNRFEIPILYHHEKQIAYPGKARNIGVHLSDSKWIAFLDIKTLPHQDWLKQYIQLIKLYNSDIIIGVTQFSASNKFQKLIRAATYGKIGHETVPGTLITKTLFLKTGCFLENVRMGEDIEWKDRVHQGKFKIYKPNIPILEYTGLPNKFIITIKKYLISSFHSSKINIQRNIKDAYLTVSLIFSAIIIPKWNYIIGGWDNNPLYIPNVTKIFLLSTILLLLLIQIFNRLFSRSTIETYFSKILKIVVFIFVTVGVYRWNAVIANWMEEAILYFPHVTKIYVGFVITLSILYRGLFKPLKRKIKPSFLFPFRWIIIGLLGLCLDLIKTPGYLGGALTAFLHSERKTQ